MPDIDIRFRPTGRAISGPRVMSAEKTVNLRTDVTDTIRRAAEDNPTLSGWMALDCAQMLLDFAADELRPRLSPSQAEELTFLAYRLRALSTEI
ncbi:MAG: hypothetical protein AAF919_18995 [Pseudomonadota bacterium]